MAKLLSQSIAYLRCPVCRGKLAARTETLDCTQCGRAFPVNDGIPVLLDHGSPEVREKVRMLDQDMAPYRYPLLLGAISVLALAWIPAERRRMIGGIGLRPGDTVLDHCTGPGGNLPVIAAAIGPSGKLVAMDLSGVVVHQARRFAQRQNIKVDIHQADAASLPYADDSFDAVIHYGAFNQFGDDKPEAMNEIVRVTKPGGTIVILDEGIEPGREHTWKARLLTWRNKLFASRPPLDLLPNGADPQVEWKLRGIFYHIMFRKPSG